MGPLSSPVLLLLIFNWNLVWSSPLTLTPPDDLASPHLQIPLPVTNAADELHPNSVEPTWSTSKISQVEETTFMRSKFGNKRFERDVVPINTSTWSPEAKEVYDLELELQKRETLSYSATQCTALTVDNYRQNNRSYFIESAKQNLLLPFSSLFCKSVHFLTCQSGTCLCRDPLNMAWDGTLRQCVVIPPGKCRGFNDDARMKNRLLTFDIKQPELTTWSYPSGTFCTSTDPFCADMKNLNMANFFFGQLPAKIGGKVSCLHCDLETVQGILRAKIKIQHGQPCDPKVQSAFLNPLSKESKGFSNRLEYLHFVSVGKDVEYCQFDKYLTCRGNLSIGYTCQCFAEGLTVDENGACVKSRLNGFCGPTSLTQLRGSPIQSDMNLPTEWKGGINITCVSVGGKDIRCIRQADTDSWNTCACPRGWFGRNCDIKLASELENVMHNQYQLAFRESEQDQKDLLEKLTTALNNFEPQLTLGLDQECNLDDEAEAQKVWDFIMALYAATPDTPSTRPSYTDYYRATSLIVNMTNNGKVYCGRDASERFNRRCLPLKMKDTPSGRHRPSRDVSTNNTSTATESESSTSSSAKPDSTLEKRASIPSDQIGYCARADYPSLEKINKIFQEMAELQVLLPMEQTGKPTSSACSTTVEAKLLELKEAQRNLIIRVDNEKEVLKFYDKLFDLKEEIKPTEGTPHPPISLCSTGQGVACVNNVCKCGHEYEWFPEANKCLASFWTICERCFNRSIYFPCEHPHECKPQSVCTVPDVVWNFELPPDHDDTHMTKYCVYKGPPMPRYKFPGEDGSGTQSLTLNMLFDSLLIIFSCFGSVFM